MTVMSRTPGTTASDKTNQTTLSIVNSEMIRYQKKSTADEFTKNSCNVKHSSIGVHGHNKVTYI